MPSFDETVVSAVDKVIPSVANVRDLIKVMNKHKVGNRVSMELFRGGERIQRKTVLEKAPSVMPQSRR